MYLRKVQLYINELSGFSKMSRADDLCILSFYDKEARGRIVNPVIFQQ